MDIVENKVYNYLFKSFLAISLMGILFYLIQEIIPAMLKFPYPAFIVVADFFGIFAIIGFIIWLFWPIHLIRNISILLSLLYVFFYAFAHFFITMYYGGPGNFIERFSNWGSSFIGLFLLTIFSIGLIIFFSMQIDKPKEFQLYEKFIIILWFLVVFVYDLINSFAFRQNSTFGAVTTPIFGITFLPAQVEIFLLLFAAIIIGFGFFLKAKQDVLLLLSLLLLNAIFLTLTIGTISAVGFDPSISFTAAKMANVFFIIGTIGIVVMTFLTLFEKYGKTTAAKSR